MNLNLYTPTGPQGLFRIISERLTGDISVTRVLLLTLPLICFIVLGSNLLGRLMMNTDQTRKGIADLVCYVIGLQVAGEFLGLAFYCWIAFGAGEKSQVVDSTQFPRELYRIYLAIYPVIAVPFGIHILEPIKSKRTKLFKMFVIIGVCLLMRGGMTLITSLPQELSRMAAQNVPRLRMSYVNDEDSPDRKLDYKARVTFENGVVNLTINLALKNPSDETFILGRDVGDLNWQNVDDYEHNIVGSLPLKAVAWSDGDVPALILKPGDAKWIKLSGKTDCLTYSKLKLMGSDSERHVYPYVFNFNLRDVDDGWRSLSFYEVGVNNCEQ